MKNRNSAADAANAYLRMAQDPNAGENFAVIRGYVYEKGQANCHSDDKRLQDSNRKSIRNLEDNEPIRSDSLFRRR